jgi:hypothetical protein
MQKLLAAAALAVALSGCATTPTPYQGCVTWEQQFQQPHLGAVSVLSPDLAKVIGVREVNTSRTATGMAAVQTAVYNCTDLDVVLIMRTRFTGARGQSESPSAWRTVHLAPRSSNVYGESAVSPATSRMQVEIQDANRGQLQFAPGQTYTPAPVQR